MQADDINYLDIDIMRYRDIIDDHNISDIIDDHNIIDIMTNYDIISLQKQAMISLKFTMWTTTTPTQKSSSRLQALAGH